jgi:hypothetical protein
VQNFISGFAAVCLYDEYTSVKEILYWRTNDTNVARALARREFATRDKYHILDVGLDRLEREVRRLA